MLRGIFAHKWKICFACLICLCVSVCALLTFYVDIDINSGRVRHQTTIGPLVISERISDTQFSAYATKILPSAISPCWRHDQSTTIWNRISPHYRYHGAIYELDQFILLAQDAKLDDSQKRNMALDILEMLKQGNLHDIGKALSNIRCDH
jgi:hypothetical protein